MAAEEKVKEEVLTAKDKREIEKVVKVVHDQTREENLRLEALKIANAVFGGKNIQAGKFLQFAAEVFEFIKGKE